MSKEKRAEKKANKKPTNPEVAKSVHRPILQLTVQKIPITD